MLSAGCQYAIHAMLYVAKYGVEGKRYVPIRQISDDLQISFHFLTKVLQILTQHGLLTSYRGPRGGVMLTCPASEIRIVDIIRSLDGDALFEACILGFEECTDDKPCALHAAWVEERSRLHQMFADLTLEELSATT